MSEEIHSPIQLDVALLRLPEVLKIFPVSKSTWWDGIKSGKYPQPVRLSPRTVAWRADEIRQLINSLTSEAR